jgi:hypothetical protein
VIIYSYYWDFLDFSITGRTIIVQVLKRKNPNNLFIK